jgi:hypothetical protein
MGVHLHLLGATGQACTLSTLLLASRKRFGSIKLADKATRRAQPHLLSAGGQVLEDGSDRRRLRRLGLGIDEVDARYLPVHPLHARGHPGAYLHIVDLGLLVRERAADRGRLRSSQNEQELVQYIPLQTSYSIWSCEGLWLLSSSTAGAETSSQCMPFRRIWLRSGSTAWAEACCRA